MRRGEREASGDTLTDGLMSLPAGALHSLTGCLQVPRAPLLARHAMIGRTLVG